jgi:dTMP kinase
MIHHLFLLPSPLTNFCYEYLVTLRLNHGVLIAFEGIDGSGKTTQTQKLEALGHWLNLEVVRTKEPTNGQWGSIIRNSKFSARLSPDEELDCFLKDRAEHVTNLIRPALDRGALVIVDRYYYSTVAYQGARGIPAAQLLAKNRAFAPIPDRVFLMDIEPKVGLGRVHTRGEGVDLFESVDQLTKAREIFLSLKDAHIVRFDAQKSEQLLQAEIAAELLAGPCATFVAKVDVRELSADGKKIVEAVRKNSTLLHSLLSLAGLP